MLNLYVFLIPVFANLDQGGSQGGFIIFLFSAGNIMPVIWKSNKIRRVAGSTITAETLAVIREALENGLVSNMSWVSGKQMLADSLTKKHADPTALLECLEYQKLNLSLPVVTKNQTFFFHLMFSYSVFNWLKELIFTCQSI